MRRFLLEGFLPNPSHDGASDYGPVAEGVTFSDGRVAVRWQRQALPSSTVCWDTLDDALQIHTGIGHWILRWLDS